MLPTPPEPTATGPNISVQYMGGASSRVSLSFMDGYHELGKDTIKAVQPLMPYTPLRPNLQSCLHR